MNRMDFHHRMPVQLRFNDIDRVGHVNNAVYQEYLDLARMEYFQRVFGQPLEWVQAGLVIAGIEIDFFEPIYLDDAITVVTRVERIGGKSLHMIQQILKEDAEEPAATARTVMVSFDYQNKKSILFPERWKEKLEAFEGKNLS
jgi:acyl-CoA thioester hydrolase